MVYAVFFFVKRNKKLVYFFFIFPAVCVHMENYFPAAIKTTFVANIFRFFIVWCCYSLRSETASALRMCVRVCCFNFQHFCSTPQTIIQQVIQLVMHLKSYSIVVVILVCGGEGEGQVRPPIICLSFHRLSDCCLCCSQQQQQPSVIHHIRCKLLCGGIVLRMKCLSVVCCCCWSF